MSKDPDQAYVDAELEFLARVDRRADRAKERRGEALRSRSGPPPVIGRVDEAHYAPPAFLDRAIEPDELNRLRALLARMRAANEEHVGRSLVEQAVLLNGDAAVLAWRAELRQWLDRYLGRRLHRPHPKDRGEPFRTFVRLFDELFPWLEKLGHDGPVKTLHRLFVDEAPDYFGWTLLERTWGPQIRFVQEEAGTRVDWGALPAVYHSVARDLLATMQWYPDGASERLLAALGRAPDPADADERAQDLAEDLAEMRPLLVRGFKPERTVVQVAPALFVAWSWNLGHHVGTILAAPSERALREQLSMSMGDTVVHVQFDGTVCDRRMAWRRLADLPGGRAATLGLLEPLHRLLFSFYDRIDPAALVRRSEQDSGPDPSPDATIAASCEVLRRREERGRTPSLGLRTTELFSVLRRLGCEVRSGKGSEIAIYKPGARIWTLTHHKRNPRVGWATIRRMLQRLEIPTEAWIAAIR